MAQVAIPLMMRRETGPRDRAILLTGLVTGMRREELASLVWGQVIESRHGRVIREGWTKNQHETGRMIGVPRAGGEFCPVGALTALAGPGPLERVFGCSPATVARVVKRAAALAGEDPARFGGHSLRAGCVSEAGAAGISLAVVMAQTGHKSTDIAASYTRDLSADQNPAALAIVQLLAGPRLM
jgi:integrase